MHADRIITGLGGRGSFFIVGGGSRLCVGQFEYIAVPANHKPAPISSSGVGLGEMNESPDKEPSLSSSSVTLLNVFRVGVVVG